MGCSAHCLGFFGRVILLPEVGLKSNKTNSLFVMNTLRETFLEELADIYDAEKQLVKALPKMAKAAENDQLREGFEEHLEQTEEHVQRLEQVFEHFGEKAKAKKCQAMAGLLEEGQELIKEKAGDAALICAAQKVEHYEIAAYGSLKSWAEFLEENDSVELLEETLDEEKSTDDKLTELAESVINEAENQDQNQEEPRRRKAA
jgi:ferritin-like metal-binding protein YciE